MASASDDIIDFFLEENLWLKMCCFSAKEGPIVIVKQRRRFGEFSTLYETLRCHEDKFREYTRMTVATFDYILEKIGPILKLNSTNFHAADSITPAQKLIVTLRFLATGNSFRSLAFSFRMGKATVANVVYETCSAIWTELVNVHMKKPTQEDLKQITSDYYRLWQFPMCMGSIDGKHCRVKCPAKSGSSYHNYKNYFSIILQAVADANKKFITIEVGGKGKQSDGGTFHYSTLNMFMENNQFAIPPPDAIPGTTIRVPYVFIADEAYPLKENIMRPFPSRRINPKSEYFNSRLSRARKCIECAFGILCAKWRILYKPIETNVKNACLIIKTTCLLHNILRDFEGRFDIDYESRNKRSNRPTRRNNSSTQASRRVREQFSNYFWNNKIDL